jgi:hypothetical protein
LVRLKTDVDVLITVLLYGTKNSTPLVVLDKPEEPLMFILQYGNCKYSVIDENWVW